MDTNIQKYMAFIKTVELGSFSKAAEILNYSQSGISRMINNLEKEWGVSLLERGRSGVRLTSDGTKLLPCVINVCREFEKLRTQVDELNGLQAGLIRIGTFSSVATHWLPNIIKEFKKDYPHIDYELLLGDYREIENWTAEGRIDCGFIRLPAAPEFETIVLEQDRFMAVLPENHPLAGLDKFPANALCEYPFILLERNGESEIYEILNKYKLEPKIQFKTWDDYAIMSMVESGLGISLLPALILKRVPYKIVIKELNVPASRSIGLILRNKKTASLAVKEFINYLNFR